MAFCLATEPREAMVTCVRALQAFGYTFEDALAKGLSIPMAEWGRYLATAWPDHAGTLPGPTEIAARLADGGVVFGPFAGFESPTDPLPSWLE